MMMIIFLWILSNIYFNSAEELGNSYNFLILKAITRPQIWDGDYAIIDTFQQIWHPKLLFEFASHGEIKQEINSELMLGNNLYLSQEINDTGTSFLNSINPSSERSFRALSSMFSDSFLNLNSNSSMSFPNSSSSSDVYPQNSSSTVYPQNFSSYSSITYTTRSSPSSTRPLITPSNPSSLASSSSFSSGSSPVSKTTSIISSTTISNPSSSSSFPNSTGYFPTLSSTISNVSVSTIQPTFQTTLIPEVACFDDLKDVGLALLQSTKYNWSLQMLDSVGKPPSGILQGAINWLGSYEECFVSVSADERPSKNLGSLEGIYCQATFSNSKNQTSTLPIPYGQAISIKEALCVPSSCSPDILKEILTLLLTQIIDLEPKLENLTLTTVSCPPRSIPLDDQAIGVLCLLSVFLLLMFLGTLYDILIHRNLLKLSFKTYSKLNDDTSRNDEILHDPNIVERAYPVNDTMVSIIHQPGIIGNILLAFSVYSNGAKILNVSQADGTLSCIHGIRFLSMSWVILGHSYVFGLANFSDLLTVMQYLDKFLFQAIANAFVSVDSFFLLSGTLVSYTFLKMHVAGKVSWLGYYLHRYWRLTPPYMLILGTFVTLMKYFGNGPLWKYDGVDADCSSWWRNLLYINNFGDFTSNCMGWTWYLANDMQFYIISPIILIPLIRKKELGFLVIGILMIATWITTGIISSVYDFQPSSYQDPSKTMSYMEKLYMKPYCRIGPYLVGIALGYILHVTKCKYHFKKKWIPWLCWALAIAMNMSIVYGLLRTFDNHPLSTEVSALYNSLHRTGWAIGLGWVIFACLNGYGGFVNTILSWKFWIPLSRLSYCAYLIHPVILYIFYNNQKFLFMFSQYLMVYMFLAHLIISYAVAFIFSLAFESPMLGLEKVFLSKIKSKKDELQI